MPIPNFIFLPYLLGFPLSADTPVHKNRIRCTKKARHSFIIIPPDQRFLKAGFRFADTSCGYRETATANGLKNQCAGKAAALQAGAAKKGALRLLFAVYFGNSKRSRQRSAQTFAFLKGILVRCVVCRYTVQGKQRSGGIASLLPVSHPLTVPPAV